MKITPYLLWLNGFEPCDVETGCWRRIISNQVSNPASLHTIEMIIFPAENGLWDVRYYVYGVPACGADCRFLVQTYQDLMKFSGVMANNRHGYTDVEPIILTIPSQYTENDWERGDLDQALFNEKTYRYE